MTAAENVVLMSDFSEFLDYSKEDELLHLSEAKCF